MAFADNIPLTGTYQSITGSLLEYRRYGKFIWWILSVQVDIRREITLLAVVKYTSTKPHT